jgi:hypothetical protein
MTSPLGGPQSGFVWDGSLNNGQVAGNTLTTQAATLSSNTTISGLGTAVSLVKGQLVTGPGVPTPDFVSGNTTSATTFTVITATTTTATETITIQNLPVLIGGENSATLAAGAALTSSYWNNTGVVRPSDTNQALFADIMFICGGTMTPSLGAVISGWFLRSYDGGTTFESAIATPGTTVSAISRPPDFQIPLDNAAYAAGNIRFGAGPVSLPSEPFKTIIQNNGTGTLCANNAIVAIPVTPAY